MSAADLGPWEPLPLEAAVRTFTSAPFRWWISGGRALAAEVIPTLNASQRDFLARQLVADHPWQRLLV